ncbi:MAG: hypothetical protein ACTSRP_00875 [Candidatus Helarchaeota archaeon]
MEQKTKKSHFVNDQLAYQVQMLPSIVFKALEVFYQARLEFPNEKFAVKELISNLVITCGKAQLAVKDSIRMGVALGFFRVKDRWNEESEINLTEVGELIAKTRFENPSRSNLIFLKESILNFKLIKGILKHLYIFSKNSTDQKINLEMLFNRIKNDDILIKREKNRDLGNLNTNIIRQTIDSWFKINIQQDKGEGGYFRIIEYEGKKNNYSYRLTNNGLTMLENIWSEFLFENIKRNYDHSKKQNITKELFENVGYDLAIPWDIFINYLDILRRRKFKELQLIDIPGERKYYLVLTLEREDEHIKL